MTNPFHNRDHPFSDAANPPRPLASHAAAFTVLELLMVISVLAVVLAIVMPSMKTIRDTALRRQAAAEATALAQAAIRYKTEYGFWPGQTQPNDDEQGTVQLHTAIRDNDQPLICIAYGKKDFLDKLRDQDGNNDRILKLYSDSDIASGRLLYRAFSRVIGRASAPVDTLNPLNPKRIHFLGLQNEHDYLTVDYRDPWNQDYVLIMGLNPESYFRYEVTGSNGTGFQQLVSNQVAFAFSHGPPNKHGTNLVYSAGVDPLYIRGGAP